MSALVIMDNFKGQVTIEVRTMLEENTVQVVYLPPNSTDLLQPRCVYQQASKKYFET